MAWIKTVDPEDAGDELRSLYASAADPESGALDNIMQIHGLHPAGLRAHHQLYVTVMRSTAGLRKVDREMIALVVSLSNGCRY